MATVTEKPTSVEGFLIEAFSDAKDGKPLEQEKVGRNLKALDDKLLEGKFDINEMDWNDVLEEVMPEAMQNVFQRAGQDAPDYVRMLAQQATPIIESAQFDMIWDHLISRAFQYYEKSDAFTQKMGQVLAEEAAVPITASQVDRFRQRCTTRTIADFSCPAAPTAFSDIFSRVDMPCAEYKNAEVCEFPLDPPPDLCCTDSNDDDPAKFYGLGPQRCWKMPYPCFMSFAFAMHRNLACVNATEFVRSQIEARTVWFNIIDEWKRTRLMFNAFTSANCDSYPYNYDGIIYPGGWFEAADGAPWTNVIQDPGLKWTTCNEGPMCLFEQMFDDMVDPVNGFPVDCAGDFQVVLTRDCTKYILREVLGARTFTRAITDGDCCGTAASQRGPRDRWSQSALYSPYAWRILVDFYLNEYDTDGAGGTLATRLVADPTLAQRTAEHFAENTYLVSKSIMSTWATIVDYGPTTRTYSGTDTWMYFDRGITWARRYDRKQTDGWLRPWLTILVRAFDNDVDVDGNAIPA